MTLGTIGQRIGKLTYVDLMITFLNMNSFLL